MAGPLGWAPVRGVIFDFHCTLGHGGDPADWLNGAWVALGRPGSPRGAFTETRYAALLDFLDRIWEHAARVDPHSERDLDPARHREVFDATVGPRADLGLDAELGDALYRTMLDRWEAYPDAVPTLRELRAHGSGGSSSRRRGPSLLLWPCSTCPPRPCSWSATTRSTTRERPRWGSALSCSPARWAARNAVWASSPGCSEAPPGAREKNFGKFSKPLS